MQVHCPPLIVNDRIIQLTDIFSVLFVYNGTRNIWSQYAANSTVYSNLCKTTTFEPIIVAKPLQNWKIFELAKISDTKIAENSDTKMTK